MCRFIGTFYALTKIARSGIIYRQSRTHQETTQCSLGHGFKMTDTVCRTERKKRQGGLRVIHTGCWYVQKDRWAMFVAGFKGIDSDQSLKLMLHNGYQRSFKHLFADAEEISLKGR